jgi:hypothetical protein
MKFGLLGYNEGLDGLLQHIATHPDHEITLACMDTACGQLSPTTPCQPADHWEGLLNHPDMEVVILAAPDAFHSGMDDQLRKFAQTGMQLLVQHPACESIVGYEVEMIRVEYGSELHPFVPGLFHPHVTTVAGWIADADSSPIGTLQLLSMERQPSSYLREEIIRQFSGDLVLLEYLVGGARSLHAAGSPHDASEWRQLNLNVVSETGNLFSWNLHRRDGNPGTRILVGGDSGQAVLELDVQGRVSLDIQKKGQAHDPGPASPLDAEVLENLLQPTSGGDEWYRAVRATEFSETIPYCLRRGRAVDIPDEPPSENRSFKGAMSIASCGILLAILGLLFAFAIFEGFRFPARHNEYLLQQQQVQAPATSPERPLLMRIWPVYPILLFLFLQFLLVLARKKNPATISSPDRTD